MPELVVFDFDGTLMDTSAALKELLFTYTDLQKLPRPDIEAFQRGYVDPEKHDYGMGMTGTEQRQFFKDFSVWMEEHQSQSENLIHAPLYDGIIEFLDWLKAQDTQMAIVTSRAADSLEGLMNVHQLSPYFSERRTFSDLAARGYRGKPHPDKLNCVMETLNYKPEETIMVGDTCHDIKMARNAGTYSVGVTWGYQDRDYLAKQKPFALLDEVSDLQRAIQSIRNHQNACIKKASH